MIMIDADFPNECSKCRFMGDEGFDCYASDRSSRKPVHEYGVDGKPDWCPLINIGKCSECDNAEKEILSLGVSLVTSYDCAELQRHVDPNGYCNYFIKNE